MAKAPKNIYKGTKKFKKGKKKKKKQNIISNTPKGGATIVLIKGLQTAQL